MKRLLMSAAIAALAIPATPAIAQDSAAPETAVEEAAGAVADAAAAATDGMAQDLVTSEVPSPPVTVPTGAQPTLDSSTPSMLGSWIEGRQVYTTNQPSANGWSAPDGGTIPAEWDSIADIDDIVIDEVDGRYVVAGYVIDIGGFLGIGAKKVLISTEAMKMATFGKDVIFATNFTREELGALPDFDDSTMWPATPTPDTATDTAPDDAAVAPGN